MNEEFTSRLKSRAAELGLDRLGITGVETPADFTRYQTWIQKGFAADLWYLTEPTRVEKRGRPELLLPGARSMIVAAVSYKPASNATSSNAKYARYAWGEDYHRVLRKKLETLVEWMKSNASEDFESRIYVDTGPILEKSAAASAGIGWIGKNTCLLNETLGSYLLLGEILTTLELPRDRPVLNHCGTCTRCLDACPTQALVGPFELQAERCISYQTIEQREGPLPETLTDKLSGWIAGCDICQEVCPWNDRAPSLRLPEFQPLSHIDTTLEEACEISEPEFLQRFGRTSLRRLGPSALRRNALAALGRAKPKA